MCLCACTVCHLSHQPLVLQQPRLPHGGLAVEPAGHLLQLLLPDQFFSQDALPVVLRPLQTLPGLKVEEEEEEEGQEQEWDQKVEFRV